MGDAWVLSGKVVLEGELLRWLDSLAGQRCHSDKREIH